MNTYQQQLWNDLMTLVAESEAFYFADQNVGPHWFRIFNYRLAAYTEFMRPNGTECRGHMFEITEDGYNAQPIRLAALPMEKFWNLNENPSTMDLDLSKATHLWHKLDGSLISSYDIMGNLYLKSKGSLASDQALASMAWLASHFEYHLATTRLAAAGHTVNFEWTAPDNRIVIGYEEPALRVLNVRDNINGGYMAMDVVRDHFGGWVVEEAEFDRHLLTVTEFIESIPDMQGVEGYVVKLPDQLVKIKTMWYLALHHTKDNINSPRRLFEAVLEEATDDMRTLFFDDPLALKTIQEMEDFVSEKYNHMVDMVERFYERNKDLSRKDYAILGQEEFAGTFYFSLAMNKYLGREFSYKDFLKGKWKQLGLKDLENDDD